MKQQKNNIFVLCLLSVSIVFVTLAGKESYEAYQTNQDTLQILHNSAVGNTEGALKVVEQEFNKIESKTDKETIHKLFAGASEYLSKCKELEGTYQFDPILGRVQSSYGWNREKYPAFTTAVSDYLVEVNYNKPKQLKTQNERFEFAKIFEGLAQATKYE